MKGLILIAVSLCSILQGSDAMIVKYQDCGSTGMVKSVSLDPCMKLPCILKYDTNVDIKVDFVTKMATKDLTAVLVAIVEGMPIPQPLPNPNACESGVKCPIQTSAENVFSQKLYIESDFPAVNMTAKLELKDDQGHSVACAMIPVTIGG